MKKEYAILVSAVLLVLAVVALFYMKKGPKNVEAEKKLKGKKVLIIISFRDFRDEEFQIPYEKLTEAGAEVDVASDQKGEAVGALSLTVQVNISLEEVDVSKYDAIIFVGGPGTPQHLWSNPEAIRIAKEAFEQNKVVAAICLAPGVLADAGVVQGYQVTAYRTARSKLVNAGANFVGGDVVVDRNLITASGPLAAERFAENIIEMLAGR